MPATATATINKHEILAAALQGFEIQKRTLEARIAAVREQLGGPFKANTTNDNRLTPEARQRIAAAQKKRWAAYRKAKGTR